MFNPVDPSRRDFIKKASLLSSGLGMGLEFWDNRLFNTQLTNPMTTNESMPNMIGAYGEWASSLLGEGPASLSFRKADVENLAQWKSKALENVKQRMGVPELGSTPDVKVEESWNYDGLHIEKLSWQLPHGPRTEALLLKPENASGKLPGILALHDHGGNKYFGKRKISKVSNGQHPVMKEHQDHYYEGRAWANEIAKKGYIVLINDAFPFASRRVLLKDVPERIRQGLNDDEPEKRENIEAYNRWAGDHEHIMAKSLFCAGTSWPGLFFAEDQIALNVLCNREDVDEQNIGCGGLSGGGMRTAFLGGLDHRVKCAVCVGFMSTWRDFMLNKSHTHTWMVYVPMLPNELDFPELFGIRVPLPTMVLNDEDDQLYTLPEMKRADKILEEVFQKAGASDKYQCSYYPGLHKFDIAMQEEAFKWWDKWLKS